MQEICPICGSKDIKVIDGNAKRYKCLSCDETFILEDKPIVKEIVRTVVEKRADTVFSAKSVYNKNINGIVEVAAVFGEDESNGTGFYVSSNGYLVTNAHVVIEVKNGKAALCDSVAVCKNHSTDFYNAEVVFLDAKNDLALLKTSGEFNPVVLSAKNVEVGDKVFAIGNSRGDGLTLLDGIVGDVNRKFKATTAFLFNALVTHGCSGGPVFDDKGEVCGVTIGGVELAAGMNYALPVFIVKDFIKKAKAEKNLSF